MSSIPLYGVGHYQLPLEVLDLRRHLVGCPAPVAPRLSIDRRRFLDRLDEKHWRARLIPFWSDVGSKSILEDLDEWEMPSTWSGILFEAVFAIGRDGAVDVDDLFAWPQDFDEILQATEWEQ